MAVAEGKIVCFTGINIKIENTNFAELDWDMN